MRWKYFQLFHDVPTCHHKGLRQVVPNSPRCPHTQPGSLLLCFKSCFVRFLNQPLVATCPEVVLVAIASPICELVASRGRRVVMPSGLKTLITSNIIISNRVVFKETLPKALWTQALSALNNLHILHIRNIRNILNMLQILHD